MKKNNENHNEELLEETAHSAADDSARQDDDATTAVPMTAETDAVSEDDTLDTELEGILGEDEENPEGAGDDNGDKSEKVKKDRRKLRYGSMATVLTVVVVAAAVLINVVAGILYDRFPLSLDLNKDKTYTLTEESVKIAKNIKKDIKITIFTPEDLFASQTGDQQMDTILRQFTEALKQYQSLSGGHVTYEYLDITGNPTLSKPYEKYEIVYGSILFRSGEGEDEKYKVLTVNDIVEQDYSNYSYTGQVTINSKVENALATGVNAVSASRMLMATIFTGHDEDSNTISSLKSLMGTNGFSFEEVNPGTTTNFHKDSILGIIAAPTKDYTEAEIERLTKWLANDGKRGRNLLVLTDSIADCPNLYDFLSTEYGITVTDNIIKETDTNRLFSEGGYEFLGDTESTEFTSGSAGDANVLMMNARQLKLQYGADEERSERNVPVVTSPDTARLVSLKEIEEAGDAQLDGTKADAYPLVSMAYANFWNYDNSGDESVRRDTYVVVCGSAGMVDNTLLSYFGGYVKNEITFMDTINAACGNEEAISITGRSVEKESVVFTETSAKIMRIVFAFAIPGLLIIVSIAVFLRRRHL